MRIGVCIPVLSRHLPLLATCLESLAQQTRQPDVVSLQVSGATAPPVLPPYSFPVLVRSTPDTVCAGANRNRAAALLQGQVDLLTFLDADDFLHPRCLEQIERHFQQDLEVLVHGFVDCKNVPEKALYEARDLTMISWAPIHSVLHQDGFSTSKDAQSPIYRLQRLEGRPFHNAHLTCRTSVWQAINWPEGFGLGEDSVYNYRLYTRGYKYGFTPDPLSYYM